VVTSAPRIDHRLNHVLERLAASNLTPAEIRRELVNRGRELGLAAPSYEHVRRLVTEIRLERSIELEQASEVLPVVAGVVLGTTHASEIVRVAHGERPRRRN
jgi:hypothetical protein